MHLNCREELDRIVRERILILDGAMGSMIQKYKLKEADYRGTEFASHLSPLAGCNDILCITKPELIASIHSAYLEAGADIITTCSLNANAVSLADYGLADKACDISRAAGALAVQAAAAFSTPGKPRFAAGSMGPTAKSASISPDTSDPGKRSIGWDELETAYYDNARGLLDGGVDLLLLETIFDTLNAKAAIAAVIRLEEERNIDIPLMISATVSDAADRLLSGQTIEAFAVSVSHARPFSLGLNCSVGAEKILPHLAALSAFTPFPVSCYPNAGLPDRFGAYVEKPEDTALFMKGFFEQGLVNIAGGCCGTTPAHIAAIAEMAKNYSPRKCNSPPTADFPPEPFRGVTRRSYLAGLEALPFPGAGMSNTGETAAAGSGFIDIGERTNVAGSRKFLRLIQNNAWEEAAGLASEMIAAGAQIIDVCMDDALLDGKAAMVSFLNVALSDPEIARFPVMPDSSRWEIIEAALKCIQGKALVNSISLKEGEAELLRRAALVRRYGAAVVVMLFDEEGQAISYERKIEIAARSFKLLTGAGFPPEDIVFDPNVLTIATGIPEHDRYALDFIRAADWIRKNCPGTHVSAGVSNLSFSFRGNEEIRSALHAVFLKHAVDAGLSMAIVNPTSLVSYDEIRSDLRDAAEDAVLFRNGNGGNYAERLLALIGTNSDANSAGRNHTAKMFSPAEDPVRSLPVEERIAQSLIKGIDIHIASDVLELFNNGKTYLEIVEGPLMRGMGETGRRFGEGKMFLPQVIRSARVMKKAIAALEPYVPPGQKGASPGTVNATVNTASGAVNTVSEAVNTDGSLVTTAGKIILATVKGDVHDIGKNIVAVILGCNGYEIIDLGVMVPPETIIETALTTGAGCIGLSGLISPSLDEMVRVAEAMERNGFTIPLLIGGAAASIAHTALRIAPAYSGPVVYVQDASQTPQVVRALLSPLYKTAFLEKIKNEYEAARQHHGRISEKRVFLTLEEARANRLVINWDTVHIPTPRTGGIIQYDQYPAETVIARLDWDSFCRSWEIQKKTGSGQNPGTEQHSTARQELVTDAKAVLNRMAGTLSLRAVLEFFPAFSENEDIVLYQPNRQTTNEHITGEISSNDLGPEIARFCFLRNQEKKSAPFESLSLLPNLCLADFILPKDHAGKQACDWLGLFALTAEFKTAAYSAGQTKVRENSPPEAAMDSASLQDDYSALLISTLANSLAEAFSEELHTKVQKELRHLRVEDPGKSDENTAGTQFAGIRPAFGYPACPDHYDKKTALALLEAQKRIGLKLTESTMMIPASSICGMYFACPQARYFSTGQIGADQLAAWAERKGISLEEAERRTGRI
jgi:5-methyltetrahydrofolate--homocysteine methyltransferase